MNYKVAEEAYLFRLHRKPKSITELSSQLHSQLSQIEKSNVKKVEAIFQCMKSACEDHNLQLQPLLQQYFTVEDLSTFLGGLAQEEPKPPQFLSTDLKLFLHENEGVVKTARACARVMSGIGSPGFPASIWCSNRFWGKYTHVDFEVILKAASEILQKK